MSVNSARLGAAASAFLALALFSLPFSQLLLGLDRSAVYQAVAGDSFYYLKLANSFVQYGFPSFDETTISNGYMPLWQALVVLLDILSGDTAATPETMVLLAFYASFALAAFGIVRLTVFVATCLGARVALLAVPFLVPGAVFWFFQNSYWITLGGGQRLGVHSWNFANGMESGVCLAIFSLIVPRVHRMSLAEHVSARDTFILGILCFLALMGRLDDVFLGFACGLLVLMLCWRQKSIRLFLVFACIPIIGSAIYMAANYLSVGSPLPSSGTSKLIPLFNGWILGDLRRIGIDDNVSSKFIPSLLGMLVGTLVLIHLAGFTKASDRRFGLRHVLGAYVLMKGTFVYFVVPLHATGLWYFTNMITSLNLIFILTVGGLLSPLLSGRALAFSLPLLGLAAGAAARNTDLQLELSRNDSSTTVNRQLCQNHDTLVPRLKAEVETPLKIVDTTDGAYAYCLGLPAVGLTGLGDSREFLEARAATSFFEAAMQRGHVIVASSPVPVASYEWRGELEATGFEATLLFSEGLVDFWKIRPAP